MSGLVHPTRKRRVFYALDVNMNFSFDSLAAMAEKMLGATLDVGDIIVCDNHNGDKRKMLQKTRDGYMIYYARLHEKQFEHLLEHNGQVKKIDKELM